MPPPALQAAGPPSRRLRRRTSPAPGRHPGSQPLSGVPPDRRAPPPRARRPRRCPRRRRPGPRRRGRHRAQRRLVDAQRQLDKIEATSPVSASGGRARRPGRGPAPLAVAQAQLDGLVRAEGTSSTPGPPTVRPRQPERITASQASLVGSERDQRREFERRRDELAALGPPSGGGETPGADDWAALVAWVTSSARARQQAEAVAPRPGPPDETAPSSSPASTTSLPLGRHRAGRPGAAHRRPSGERPAEVSLEKLEEEAGPQGRGRGPPSGLRHDRDEVLSRTLAQHLKADRFERWILDEAHDHRLLDGATEADARSPAAPYSLTVDDKPVRGDRPRQRRHRPAARTLSGGETFLVSLALAPWPTGDRRATPAAWSASNRCSRRGLAAST